MARNKKAEPIEAPPLDEADVAPVGRPTDYDPAFAKQVEKICALGATDTEIAEFFSVSVRTIYRWKLQHPEFCQSVKNGKEHADERVERSLFQRASGYSYVEQQAFKVKTVTYENGKRATETEEIKVVDVERQQPPDTTAAIFWMKNRRADQWRDVHKHEHGRPGDFDNMSDDELRTFVAGRVVTTGESDEGTRKTRGSRKAGEQLN